MPTLARPRLTMATVLLSSCLTVMAAAIIAPSLPGIASHFASTPNADLLARLVLVLPALTIVFAAPVMGWVADKVGPRSLLIWASLLFVLGGFSGAVVDSLPAILAGRVVLGIGVAGLMVGGTTAIAALYDEDRRSTVLGYQGAAAAMGGVLFLIGGGLLADVGWRYPFFIYLSALVVVPMAFTGIPHNDHAPRAGVGEAPFPLIRLLPVYALALVAMIGFYLVPGQVPFLVAETGMGGPAVAGIAIASSTLATAIIAVLYGRIARSLSKPQMLLITFALLALGLTAASFATSLIFLLVCMAVAGIGMGLFQPTATMMIIERVDDNQRGRATSLFASSLFLGQFSSAFVAGLAPKGNSAVAFQFVGAAILAATAVAALLLALRPLANPASISVPRD
jgi:MFS family permease